MSLASDFNMYYSETFVGLQTPNGLVPLYVHAVSFDSNANIDFDTHDPNAMEHLMFHVHDIVDHPEEGITYSSNSRRVSINDLVLDMPKLGYYDIPGEGRVWLSYNPQRSTKKGFTFRRTTWRGDSNRRRLNLVRQVFSDTRSDFERNFHFVRDRGFQRIMYKGLNVGRLNPDNDIRLHPEAGYLREIVQDGLGVQDANNAS